MPLTQESAARKDAKSARADVTFTHKQFAKIAAIIAKTPWQAGSLYQQKLIAEHFADNLAETNPRFDRARFLRACGVAS